MVSFGNAERFHGPNGDGSEYYLRQLEERLQNDRDGCVHVWSSGEIVGQILTAGYALSDRASCRGMAHSTDLRERIINAVIHKRYTLQKAADTFDVGAATVSRYLRRYRQTGNLTPRTSPGRPSALVDHQAWVEQSLIGNDLTHDQRCDLLFDEIGVRIGRATMCRWVQRLGSTRKKDDLRR